MMMMMMIIIFFFFKYKIYFKRAGELIRGVVTDTGRQSFPWRSHRSADVRATTEDALLIKCWQNIYVL